MLRDDAIGIERPCLIEALGKDMLFILCMAAAIIQPSTPSGAPSPSVLVNTQSADAQVVEGSIVKGAWTGQFLQRNWTFEFRNEDGKRSGRYMRSDGRSWQPLNDLRIEGGSVAFDIESKPQVSFSLKRDATNQNLSGTVTIDGIATIPFSAVQVP